MSSAANLHVGAALRVFLVLLMLGCPSALARDSVVWEGTPWVLDRWSTEDCLPLNHQIDLVVDEDGYVWIATLDGLARFDGQRCQVFRRASHPELPGNRVIAVELGPDGLL